MLMSVAKPCIALLPPPLMSHSEAGLPGLVFSHGIGLSTGGSHGPAAPATGIRVGPGLSVANSSRTTTSACRRSRVVPLIRDAPPNADRVLSATTGRPAGSQPRYERRLVPRPRTGCDAVVVR